MKHQFTRYIIMCKNPENYGEPKDYIYYRGDGYMTRYIENSVIYDEYSCASYEISIMDEPDDFYIQEITVTYEY